MVHHKDLYHLAKPVIDEQEWQLIGQVLQDSFNNHTKVNLSVFDSYSTW
ncbi:MULTISPECIES: YolD-like family protein [Paenibacillus]